VRILLRLGPLLRPYRLQIALNLSVTLGLACLALVVPAIIQRVIDIGLAQRQAHYLALSALILFGLGLVRASLIYSQRYLSEWISAHIGYDLRNRLYDHIQYLPFNFHDHTQTGQLISRCIEDVRAVERFTGFGVAEMIRLGLLMVGITTILFWQSAHLASIALLPMIPLILLTTGFGSRVGEYFLKADIALGDLSARVQENVSGVQVVRAFAREPYEISRFDHKNRYLYRTRVAVSSLFAWVMPSSHFLVALGTILILWFGGNMVLHGEMTIGEVVAFNSYLLLLAAPAQQLVWLVNTAGEATAGLQRSFEILDLKPEIESPPEAITLPPLLGRVEFRQISLNYPEQITPALRGINLIVQPNQLIALIGPTGSGKTSLVNLLPRFYDPSQGTILVDGVDICQVELTSLRRQIGIVLQTSLLFSCTIAENIAFGRPEASQAEIEAAARAAQAHEFILELPQGYQTVVGERGITLSGGQRQRIAIARALLMDPRILILDDSTSSVDTETEKLIQGALERLMEGRTTFVIAHRLSTVRRADLILVMKDGRIVESGKHNQLLLLNGLYRQTYDLQLREQEQLYEAA
jgi:ATP-binding cassette subfamily B multidrug efflux pump